MAIKVIKFSKEFTRTPGGRYVIHGDFSGEEFRTKFLEPSLEAGEQIDLDLNNVLSFPRSFIDEAFGELVTKYGIQKVKKSLSISLNDNPVALERILFAIESHAA